LEKNVESFCSEFFDGVTKIRFESKRRKVWQEFLISFFLLLFVKEIDSSHWRRVENTFLSHWKKDILCFVSTRTYKENEIKYGERKKS
jgi:hypothetical protein